MAYKILHFADLHLDTSFVKDQLSADYGRARRLSLRAALARLIARARELKVDTITIGGDLFDQGYLIPETAEFLLHQFAKVAPIRVIIAPGENDPYTNDSIYARLTWPENVDIFYQNKLTALELAPRIHLWGAANPPARNQRLLDGFKMKTDNTNLLLLHAALDTKSQHEMDPVYHLNTSAIENAGFALALYGHEHKGRIWPEERSRYVYPGSPEPLNISESAGNHLAVLVEIQDGGCSMKPIALQEWHYALREIDLTGCESIEKAAREVKDSILLEKGWRNENTIFYVTLIGKPDFLVDVGELRELVNSSSYLRTGTAFGMEYDLDGLAIEQTVRGFLVQRFLSRLANMEDEEERRLNLTALNFALQVFDRQEVGLHEVAQY